ncbi:MAG: hypothetical protein JKY24_07180 [Pseudomonadales bacterium]|nr:hypothetical protein [Pseudomonadales bacterium]
MMKLSNNSKLRFFITLLTCAMLSGCAVKFVYNQLDWVIPWYLQDYIPLNDAQKDYLNTRIDHHLVWHRQTQLPEYARFLRSTAVQISNGFTREEIDSLHLQLSTFGQILSDQIASDIAQLFLSSNDKQLVKMVDKFNRDNKRFKKTYIHISEENLRKLRLKETRKYLERWLGGLTRHQQDELKTWSTEFKPIAREVLAHKLLWQKNLKALMKSRNDSTEFKQQLTTFLANPGNDWKSEYTAKTDFNKERITALFLRLDAHMTQRQRNKLIKKLNSLANDLMELSAKT